MERKSKEEYAIVLDFLQNGYPFDSRPSHKKTPIVQAMGKEHFTLLELVPKPGITIQPNEEVYIGDEKREKIHHISGKLPMDRLTATANAELEPVINELITKNEAKFIEFFNKAAPITIRMHQLELLPGFGKKHMVEILEAREDKPFGSFDDLKSRVKLLPDPKKAIAKRIVMELEGEQKHRLFVDR
ncbi:DNA-binding protein [Candidatus Woesearchaeota archaeon CG10_big_fil_rev_8_21_14_0_10_44_13]|nr:MAG: DNA-binding protein [Candidatus Woesearchaeota archaeon CG10_big_fil_rev_8_21_14_0_10_44_13]